MARSRITTGVVFVILTLFTLAAGPQSLLWQSGQIVSMKEDALDRDGDLTSYVYGVRAKDRTYMVVIAAPLKAYIHSTVRFAIDKNLLCIQDLDGKLRKASIIEQPENQPHH